MLYGLIDFKKKICSYLLHMQFGVHIQGIHKFIPTYSTMQYLIYMETRPNFNGMWQHGIYNRALHFKIKKSCWLIYQQFISSPFWFTTIFTLFI